MVLDADGIGLSDNCADVNSKEFVDDCIELKILDLGVDGIKLSEDVADWLDVKWDESVWVWE